MELLRALFLLSVNGEVSEARLRGFLKECETDPTDLMDTTKPLGCLFAEFRGKSGFLPEKVGLLIALMGTGTPENRGEAMFHCYDLDHNEFLSRAELTLLLTEVADLALLHLPLYASACLTQRKQAEAAQQLKDYTTQLGRKQQAAVSLLLNKLIQDKLNITALSFIASLKDEGKALCSPESLRLFVQNPSGEL